MGRERMGEGEGGGEGGETMLQRDGDAMLDGGSEGGGDP